MNATTVTVPAARLQAGDEFLYQSTPVRVLKVTPLDARLVEVHVADEWATSGERFLDYGKAEQVEVGAGPSTVRVAPAPRPATTATQRAREAVRGGKVRTLPASAALVLYALAAAQDESAEGIPSTASVATGAGLAISTTTGHLRALAAKGLVVQHGTYGWAL